MADVNLIPYRQQVFDFLNSLTLKYYPLVDAANKIAESKGHAVDRYAPETWKYYMNVRGMYHPSDTLMTITSADTLEDITFSKENLLVHPKTASLYYFGSPAYENLCERYPEQTGLIKTILYPCTKDVSEIITCNNFTILAYGSGYLESYEQDAMIDELYIFLNYVHQKWYNDFLRYELYFDWAFWGMLWQSLASFIFVTRLRFTHTVNVHSYHIWEYLIGYGISNYQDVLTRKQALFLYRNMRYIRANRGKQSNLELLVNNIMDRPLGLCGKYIAQNVVTKAADCRYLPEITSRIIPTNYSKYIAPIDTESIGDMVYKLFDIGCETDTSVDHIDKQETMIGKTRLNSLSTKILEIRHLSTDTKYANILNSFILDTLVYLAVNNRYMTRNVFTDENTGITFSLDVKETLAFLYYCIQRTKSQAPVYLPQLYTPHCGYKDVMPEIPEFMEIDGYTYHVRTYIDVDFLTKDIDYPQEVITEPDQFISLIYRQFTQFVKSLQYARTETHTIAAKILDRVRTMMAMRTSYLITLSPITRYEDWLVSSPGNDFLSLIRRYDSLKDPRQEYDKLSEVLLQGIVNISDPRLKRWLSNTDVSDEQYVRLKNLFVQLCSYSILFLEHGAQKQDWMTLSAVTCHDQIELLTESDIYLPFPVTGIPTELTVTTDVSAPTLHYEDDLSFESETSVNTRLSIDDDIETGDQITISPSTTITSEEELYESTTTVGIECSVSITIEVL